jgi:anti-sigma factor RsiW
MRTCKFFCEQLSDYLDGELADTECELIEDHLEVCPPCNMMYQSLKTTVEICNLGIPEEIPEDIRVRLKRFLREHCGGDACEEDLSRDLSRAES